MGGWENRVLYLKPGREGYWGEEDSEFILGYVEFQSSSKDEVSN